ncbi:MAG TPA: DnaJ domain-containing protein [Ktedonobacteraceae bacterium]|nr:DnaJ domain-containing protein [Ktedonobacteraceae bacterium]
MEQFTDYYAVLGIETDAPASVIKTNFKHLALQYHPDVYKGEDAQERMRVLLLAYQTLSNPETRKAYDSQHAHHFMGVPSENNRVYVAHTGFPPSGKPHKAQEISPTARRDRQRHYAFPKLNEGKPVHIALGEMSYDLSVDEAHILHQEGLLRGVEMVREGQQLTCHRCHHRWMPEVARTGVAIKVRSCPACNALDWAEYLLLHCSHCSAVFESEQIRYEVGSIHYGDANLCPPYELFPLCPYCASAGWCPAEDARVYVLRREAERKAALLRGVWLMVAVVAIIVVGAVMVNIVR